MLNIRLLTVCFGCIFVDLMFQALGMDSIRASLGLKNRTHCTIGLGSREFGPYASNARMPTGPPRVPGNQRRLLPVTLDPFPRHVQG